MAFTAGDIETLKQAIVDRKGARTISFGEQSATFESIDDMLTLLTLMQADVAVAAGRTRTRFAKTSKGV